jgi:hypothetical protein
MPQAERNRKSPLMRKLLLLNVAALSPSEITGHTPTLAALANAGSLSALRAPFPALTCT